MTLLEQRRVRFAPSSIESLSGFVRASRRRFHAAMRRPLDLSRELLHPRE
jgi:hypothetical protein